MNTMKKWQKIEVVEVEPRHDFRLWLKFSDGFETIYDVSPLIKKGGPYFKVVGKTFNQVRVDPDVGTVVWPNGADLDPYVLRGKIPNLHGGKREGAGRKKSVEQSLAVSFRLLENEVKAIMKATKENSPGKAIQKWVKSHPPRQST